MKIKIRPGETIIIFLENEGSDPRVASVLVVQAYALTVAEFNSSNGLASVIYNEEKGYCYFYPLEEGNPASICVHVERIERGLDDGERITGYFIEGI